MRNGQVSKVGAAAVSTATVDARVVLDRLLARHRELILASAAELDDADREEAIMEGVHGLMDAMTLCARGDVRPLDVVAAECVERRIAELAAWRAMPMAA